MAVAGRLHADILVGLALAWVACAGPAFAGSECGMASWYGLRGQTASGEYISDDVLTAAHRSLPFGTLVRLDNLANGKSVIVRINDRGPFKPGRDIDVTRPVAEKLDFTRTGLAHVRMTVVGGKGALPNIGCAGTAMAGDVPLPRVRPMSSARFASDFTESRRTVGVLRVASVLAARQPSSAMQAAVYTGRGVGAWFDDRFGSATDLLGRVERASM